MHQRKSVGKLANLIYQGKNQGKQMKRVVLYIKDKCPHCKDAQRYLDSKGVKYRLCNAKMERGRKELDALGVRSVPVLKIGDQLMIGWNPKNFDRMYGKG